MRRAPLTIILGTTAILVGSATRVFSQSDSVIVTPDYRNLIYDSTSTNEPAAVAFFSGNVGSLTNSPPTLTDAPAPSDGQIYLVQSIIGQPVGIAAVPFDLFVQGEGTITPSPNAYAANSWFQLGQTVVLTPTPGRYYAFSGWSDGGVANPRQVVAGPTNSYTAIFTNTVALETNSIGGAVRVEPVGTPFILLNGALYSNNIVVTNAGAQLQATIQTTYPNGIIRYTTDGSDPINGTLYTAAFTVTAPFQVRATAFKQDNSDPETADPVDSLSLTTPGGGTVSAAPQTDFYTGAASAILTASPAPGWTFMNWTGDTTDTNAVTILVMNGPESAQAIFGTTVNPGANGNGYVTNVPPLSLYAYGSVVRLEAVPAAGSQFASWGGAVSGSFSPVDFTVTNASPNIQANFSVLSGGYYSLTVLTFGGGDYSANPPGNAFPNGTGVMLTATPRAGQSFIGWSGDATGTNNPLSVTMTNNQLIHANFAVTQPLFAFSAQNYFVNEAAGTVPVVIQDLGVLGTNVTVSTADGTAVGGTDYKITSTNLVFAGGPSSQTINIPIYDEWLQTADRTFQVKLSGVPSTIGTPSNSVVIIHYNDGITTNGSELVQAYPGPTPPNDGALQVWSSPTNTAGQWHFRWEDGWHNSGDEETNLQSGFYDVEFRNIAGYTPLPVEASVFVFDGPFTPPLTNQYYATLPPAGLGSLQVTFFGTVPAGAGWRLQGETAWRTSGETAPGLIPGTNYLQFETVAGMSAPAAQAIVINTNLIELTTLSYQPYTLPGNVAFPDPLNFSLINVAPTETPRMPYVFNGQLKSPLNGWGSGVAVLSNVVLTASHVVFDYNTLTYAESVHWFFQEDGAQYNPIPLSARGWNVLSGYAAARAVDETNGLTADQSSAQSRDYDVAALYFGAPVARGGFGGYLSSDDPTNEWLAGSEPKMVVGYPVDASEFGDTNVIPDDMHTTQTITNGFQLQNDRVYGTTALEGFPGNSGGPVYALCTNGLYYPAAVYLGQVNNSAVMRAIDSNVVDLIVRSAVLEDTGTNNTGGGVITLVASAVTANNPAYVQVILGPPAAVQAGAGWQLLGDDSYGSAPNYTRTVTTNNAAIEFKQIPGWVPPASLTASVSAGGITVISNANYTVVPPTLSFSPGSGFAITGTSNTEYLIEYSTNLAGGAWLPLETNALGTGSDLIAGWPPTNGPAAFYRAVWLP